MNEPAYFHTAILVPDLDEALAVFAKTLQVEFTTATAHCENFVDRGERRVLDLRVAYSKTPQPYFELVEAQPSGVYSADGGFGVHHVGVWEPDCEAKLVELQEAGLEVEGVQYDPDGRIIVAYFYPQGISGMRLELVDEGRRPMMEAWIAGGAFVS